MKRVMKRRFEEEDAMSRSKEPNEDDADLQQGPDLTQAIIKPGFECFTPPRVGETRPTLPTRPGP